MLFIEIFKLSNYDFLNPWSAVNIVCLFIFLFFSAFVIYKNPKKRVNITLGLFSFFLAWWQMLFFFAYNTDDADLAYLLIKIGFIGVILFSIMVMHFAFAFFGIDKKYKTFLIVNYAFALFFEFALFYNGSLLGPVEKHFWGYYTTDGVLFIPFLFWFSLMMFSVIIVSIHFLRKESIDRTRRTQTKYFILATFIAFLGAPDFLPNFGIEIYPYSYVTFTLFTGILIYAMVKYRLMDVETVIHKTAMWVATSASLGLPLFLLIYFFQESFNLLGPFLESAILIGLAVSFVKYYNYFQPKIDQIFRRKAHDLEKKADWLVASIFTILDINTLQKNIKEGIKDIFFARSAEIYVKKEENFLDSYGEKLELEQDLLEFILKNRETIAKKDIRSDPGCSMIAEKFSEWMSRNTYELLIPITTKGMLAGLIGVQGKDNLKQYSKEEISVLEKIGKESTIPLLNALENEKMINQERELKNKLQKFNEELEKKVEERTNEIIVMNRKLEEAYQELKDLDIKKDEFISIGAHELKTPLTSIKGFAQLLGNETIIEDKEEREKFLELINKNTEKLYNLILDMVDSSRISVGKLSLNIEDTDPKTIFDDIKENMTLVIKNKGLEPIFSIEDELPKIKADAQRIQQVLRNLIMNAVNHTEKGSITLDVRKKEGKIEFTIKDTGEGIPKENQKYIFSRFYQVDSTLTRKVSGSGLGLSISKGLVELMNGKIWFESEPGQGTTFAFTIP